MKRLIELRDMVKGGKVIVIVKYIRSLEVKLDRIERILKDE